MKRSSKAATRILLGIALTLLGFSFSAARALADDTTVRWDIISLVPTPSGTNNVLPGGNASAAANDGSLITVTGSGTFVPGDAEEVTGGGTWQIGTTTETYQVTALVSFEAAPGTAPSTNVDMIDPAHPTSAGLAVLRIAYSDGSRGILIVSCHLVGTPDSVFEGITASKGFVDFWNRVKPLLGVDANRTVFHIIAEAD